MQSGQHGGIIELAKPRIREKEGDNMKKHRLHNIVLGMVIMALVMGLAVPAFAANDEADQAAQALYELGLFSGTGLKADGTPNFDLNRSPTRQEAITMLVRLLGKEKEAQAGTWETPFTDVDGWAKPYVGYAYTNHLTGGTSSTTFSGNDTITASQYITFILRALGYADGADFQWDKAWELSDKIGLTSGEYSSSTVSFLRGDVANISCTALTVCLKNSDKKLSDKLIDEGIFTREAYTKLEGTLIGKKAEDKDWVGVRDMYDARGLLIDTVDMKDLPAIAAAITETNAKVAPGEHDLAIRPADAYGTQHIYLQRHVHDYPNGFDAEPRYEYCIRGLGDYVGKHDKETPNNSYFKVIKAILDELISDPEDIDAIYKMVENADKAISAVNQSCDEKDIYGDERVEAVDKVATKIFPIKKELNTVIVEWEYGDKNGIEDLIIYNKLS